MHEYQEELYRMRLGQTDRAISRDRILGRPPRQNCCRLDRNR